jgi:hypothetical protein
LRVKPLLGLICCVLASSASSADKEMVSVAEMAERALQHSQLTFPGARPFHLTATIAETTDPNSDYRAKIEEYWVSPTKWRRTIESPGFSQIRTVNGDAVFEKNTGDYFPVWLNQMLTALFDPLPMLSALKQGNAQMPRPGGGMNSTACADFHSRIDRWVICFEGSGGLLSSVFTKGYAAEFKDYAKFGEKRVARRIVDNPEPGVTLETRITSLVDLTSPDETLFEISQPTPVADQIRRVRVSDDTLRSLVQGGTEIAWPTVGAGPFTGGCAVYVSADRAGHVREAWPEGCDNASLQDPLRDAIKAWLLKPAVADGATVQVESLMGFTFHAELDSAKALPLLSDAELRKLAKHIVEPNFPANSGLPGTEFIVQISVDENGKLTGLGNTHKLSGPVLKAIYAALLKWDFSPYLRDGKPQYFHADVVFRVP